MPGSIIKQLLKVVFTKVITQISDLFFYLSLGQPVVLLAHGNVSLVDHFRLFTCTGE